MKRTTVMIDEACYARVKQAAARDGRTLSDVLNELLRLGLAAIKRPRSPAPFDFPTFSMGLASVNVADREQLAQVMGGR